MAKNQKNADCQRKREFKIESFEQLVKYASSIRPLLEKYKPDYKPPKESQKKPATKRRKWILGVD